MKTAVTVLQELMMKLGEMAEYECISQTGPQHQATFDYRCMALGMTVTASARSKKEAKQEVARVMLQKLSACGHPVPPPFSTLDPQTQEAAGGSGGSRSYVALLKELCEEYKLPAMDYVLVGDTGPPHLRHFTMAARVGAHERIATSTTKKAARQMAAEALYTYLRENLARLTKDFVEEEALVRAHEKAMERYAARGEEAVWRPDLGQRIADYHLGLVTHIDEGKVELGAEAVAAAAANDSIPADVALEAATAALGMQLERAQLGARPVLRLTPASPALAFFSAERALQYLQRALRQRRPDL